MKNLSKNQMEKTKGGLSDFTVRTIVARRVFYGYAGTPPKYGHYVENTYSDGTKEIRTTFGALVK